MKTLKEFIVENDHLQNYVGDSSSINSALRNNSKIHPADGQTLHHLGGLVKPVTHHKLYRVLDDQHPEGAHLAKVKVGKTYHDNAFMSTTHSEAGLHHLISSMDDYGGTPKHVMHIHDAHKLHGIDVNQHLGNSHYFSKQHEVLVNRGTTLRKFHEEQKDGVTHHHFRPA